MKTSRVIFGTLMFSSLFVAIHVLHFSQLHVDVVFFAAIADAVLAAVLASVPLFVGRYFRVLGGLEKIQLLTIWLLAGYGFAISIPTVIDRSLSFYILEKIEQRGGGILQDKIGDVFTKEYLAEYRLVDVRLTEQLQSGTIVIENNCVKITPKGTVLANFAHFYRKYFLPKRRLLMGQYTNALITPFEKSSEIVDYRCK